MPVPLELLRAALGVLGVFFAYLLGRAAGRARHGQRRPRLYGWLVRTVVTLAAIAWRHGLDTVTVAALAGAAAAAAAGAAVELRPRKPDEDASRQIFPE